MRSTPPVFVLLAVATTLLVAACGTTRSRPRRYLSDVYSPSSSPALELPGLDVKPVQVESGQQKVEILAPNGRRYTARWDSISESYGPPNAGGIRNAVPMPKTGTGFRCTGRNPWGTDETVTFLQLAAYLVHVSHPDGPDVLIGDISAEEGGRLRPHKSHQTGRDADVGLYAASGKTLKSFGSLPPRELDVIRTWTFFEVLLRTGAVRYLFIDRRLHAALESEAASRGLTDEALDKLFESRGGDVIKHVPGHDDHLHVRFRCPLDDVECVE
ncbi:MAG: penicillin-insensitive murein endopeptidase [Myxococcales bacterium]|nr:penicillin-insensitive murein endopeptidase [Myxococcales bacterium]